MRHKFSWPLAKVNLYLSNQEVHVLLHEHIQLFLEDGLNITLTLAAQVGRSLTSPPSHKCVSFIGNLAGQIAGGLVDLSSLQNEAKSW